MKKINSLLILVAVFSVVLIVATGVEPFMDSPTGHQVFKFFKTSNVEEQPTFDAPVDTTNVAEEGDDNTLIETNPLLEGGDPESLYEDEEENNAFRQNTEYATTGCLDSDSMVNNVQIDVNTQSGFFGTATGKDASGNYKVVDDSCLNINTVYENYCQNGVRMATTVDCGLGEMCIDGYCQQDLRSCTIGIDLAPGTCCTDDDCSQGKLCGYADTNALGLDPNLYGVCYDCVDSEGGIYLYKNKPVSGVNALGNYREDVMDSCKSQTSVREFYCSNNMLVYKEQSCQSGETCSNGICQKQSFFSKIFGSKQQVKEETTTKTSLYQKITNRLRK